MGGCAAWNPFEDWWRDVKREAKRKWKRVTDIIKSGFRHFR